MDPKHIQATNRSTMRLAVATIGLCFLCTAFTLPKAQKQDFGAWYALSIEKPLFRWLEVSVSPELRYYDNHSRLKSWLIETDLTVKINPYLRVGALYRYAVDFSDMDANERNNRLGVFAKASYRIKPFDLSYRCQLQEQFTNYHSSENGKIPEVVWRHKFEIAYSKKKYDFKPYAYAEWFRTVSPGWDANEQKLRFSIGLDYDFTKKLKASIGYVQQSEYNVKNPLTMHIIATQIKYEWK
ncbi:MAG: DUF2490 domain-containing protein [Breznakibacter sp.]